MVAVVVAHQQLGLMVMEQPLAVMVAMELPQLSQVHL
jgi:hypothetical protein